ncbi:MAG TPA: PDZ domain-containing protein, partial [Patescibacteria group bacterium]|nr:PDZ domain-containing protein [Patescibacteria group bacterium]
GDNVRIEGDTHGGGPIARRIGSGIVFDRAGHVVTLSSVVSGATEVIVLTAGGDKVKARVRGVDDYSGIAVLDLDQAGASREFAPVAFGDSDGLKIGALVTAFSSPFENPGSAPVYSFGFVSGMGVSQGPARRCSYIKFNAYAPPGAGGGPVLDSSGRLVGMLFGAGGGPRRQGEDLIHWDEPLLRDDDQDDVPSPDQTEGHSSVNPIWILKSLKRAGSTEGGVAYAVPGNLVRRVSDQIIRTGAVRRGWVGVKIEESEPGEIRLLGVVPGGPADRAGLLAGDRIIAFNGLALTTAALLVDGISSSEPGTSVKLGIDRDGRKLTVPVSLGQGPEPPPPPRAAPAPMVYRMRSPVLGVEVDTDTDDEVRQRLGAPEGVGLLVQTVHDDSRAGQAGLQPGDLLVEALGEPIRELEDLRRVLRRQGGREMQVTVFRKGKELVLHVAPAIPPVPPTPAPAPAPRSPRRP